MNNNVEHEKEFKRDIDEINQVLTVLKGLDEEVIWRLHNQWVSYYKYWNRSVIYKQEQLRTFLDSFRHAGVSDGITVFTLGLNSKDFYLSNDYFCYNPGLKSLIGFNHIFSGKSPVSLWEMAVDFYCDGEWFDCLELKDILAKLNRL